MKEIEPDSDFSEQKYLNITKDDVMDESSSLKYIKNITNNKNIEKPQKKADDNKKDNSRFRTLFSFKNYPLLIVVPGCKYYFIK
jgi:hypothetical protein